jgi:hypothetical protein
LWKGVSAISPSLVVEGPLASNFLYLSVLQALLPRHALAFSSDALEGTARGAWLLCHWTVGQSQPNFLRPAPVCALQGLMDYHLRWVAALG